MGYVALTGSEVITVGFTVEQAGQYGGRVVAIADTTGVIRRDALRQFRRWLRALQAVPASRPSYEPYPGAVEDALKMCAKGLR
ncbi:hypothetical protein Rctr197k_168 [Virus Rctr197k]|nr:hypothetical protein Rctr197k_168 [Virus Rctr197k]